MPICISRQNLNKCMSAMFLALKRIYTGKGLVCGKGYVDCTSRSWFHIWPRNFSTMDFGTKPYTVFVEGNIGSGKTTFLSHFSKYEALILAEPVELWRNVRGHNMLELMYKEPARWGLAFQTIVQKTMLDLHMRQTSKPVKMMERSIYSARYCFVENLHRSGILASPDFAVLDEWFRWITKHMETHADLIVYLRTDPEVVYQRVKARARAEEAAVPLEYLHQLHKLHDDWLLHGTNFPCPAPVIVVDANKSLSQMAEEYARCEAAMLDHSGRAVTLAAPLTLSPTKIIV